MSASDPRATVDLRMPAADLKPGDIVNTSPGVDEDWQEVLAVYASPATLGAARDEVRTLVKALKGRYVVVELSDIAPVDSNVYYQDGVAMALGGDDEDDQPVAEVVSQEDGVRTYLYTKFELVTVRGRAI
jgi:hypothetical protein